MGNAEAERPSQPANRLRKRRATPDKQFTLTRQPPLDRHTRSTLTAATHSTLTSSSSLSLLLPLLHHECGGRWRRRRHRRIRRLSGSACGSALLPSLAPHRHILRTARCGQLVLAGGIQFRVEQSGTMQMQPRRHCSSRHRRRIASSLCQLSIRCDRRREMQCAAKRAAQPWTVPQVTRGQSQ